MAQLGWLEWRLTDEALPDLFDMVDSAYPEMSKNVERRDLEEEIADPRVFAQELAKDIVVTLTGQFPAVTSPREKTQPVKTTAFMRRIPRPADSRPLIDHVEAERRSVSDSGEFSHLPHTGTSAPAVPRQTPDSVPGFELDPDIAAMFSDTPVPRRDWSTDDDVTVEVDLSDLQREKRNRR